MAVNKSGICKIVNCNKLQVRDGYCKQCGEYYLQKEIMTKLNTVGDELAKIQTVGGGQNIVQQNNNDEMLVNVLTQQTSLLQNMVVGLNELKETIKSNPTQQIIREVVKETSSCIKKKKIIEDDVFVPSAGSINFDGEMKITDEKHDMNNSKSLSGIADKLNKLNSL